MGPSRPAPAAAANSGRREAPAAPREPGAAFACLGLGLVHVHKGDVQRAIPPLERGLQLCQVAQVALVLPLTTSWLSSAYALSGRMAEGLPLLEQSVEQAANNRWSQSPVIINLGQGYLLAGRVEDAMRQIGRAHV